jgi:two-component system sensor histidine kinase PilS (NtrC family)
VVVTVLLGATAFMEWRTDQVAVGFRLEVALVRLVVTMMVLSLAYVVLLRLVKEEIGLIRLAYGQLTGDVLFSAALVLITGGTSSVFTFFFSLIIVLSAVLLYRTGALYMATASSLLLVVIGMLELGVLGAPAFVDALRLAGVDPIAGDLPGSRTIFRNIVANVVAFYAIAFLGSYLVSQLRRSDEQIQRSRLSLEDLRVLHRNIVSSIQSGLITIDEDLGITFFNREAERITGFKGKELLGEDIGDHFSDLKQILLNEDKVMSQNQELTLHVFDGELSYVQWTISPLIDARQQFVGRVLIFEDVTRDRAMQERVKKSEQFASLGRVSAAIAHEIRNPLASISGSIQLLGSTLELSEEDQRLMEIVGRETESLNQWITDFLTYARPRMGEFVDVDLARLLSDGLLILKGDEKSANIETALEAPGECFVNADPTYLKQVIWNILNNAVQAMPEGGTLTVSLVSHEDHRGRLHRASFTDTGVGIPEHVRERLFEPFYTTRKSGTGLGLATAYRIVTEMNGSISVESEVGVGTTFMVELPSAIK